MTPPASIPDNAELREEIAKMICVSQWPESVWGAWENLNPEFQTGYRKAATAFLPLFASEREKQREADAVIAETADMGQHLCCDDCSVYSDFDAIARAIREAGGN
jgi:hypothetical protein